MSPVVVDHSPDQHKHEWTWGEPSGLPGMFIDYCKGCGQRKGSFRKAALESHPTSRPKRLVPIDYRMTPTDWEIVRGNLGIPWGWKLQPRWHEAGYWTLAATEPRRQLTSGTLPCGHRSMQVTATTLPLAVARLANSLRFHQRDCGG